MFLVKRALLVRDSVVTSFIQPEYVKGSHLWKSAAKSTSVGNWTFHAPSSHFKNPLTETAKQQNIGQAELEQLISKVAIL
jgi:hypothetical protein